MNDMMPGGEPPRKIKVQFAIGAAVIILALAGVAAFVLAGR